MHYLFEHEAGRHAQALGFPSISGCQAICFLATEGLYGFHNLGGDRQPKLGERARLFADFVRRFNATPAGLHLYGATFAAKRYGPPQDASWKAELAAFAEALGYTGPISACDLGVLPGSPESAYVEFRRQGAGCLTYAQTWSDGAATYGTYTSAEHQNLVAKDPEPKKKMTAYPTNGNIVLPRSLA